ncbi:hypothetical protein [Pseudoduganella sp. GCM10020061]|uniref:hypothetical protein n=1 Tax=Pseudoduganella sp. GCM10020061 TaxID=3317345 RepID=UPI00363D7BD0
MRALIAALLLAGCASAPQQEIRTVPLDALTGQIVAGHTTREQARALGEPVQRIRFDSGYEAWLYNYPGPAGAIGEYVILFAPSGVVHKTRTAIVPLPPP